jgi:hypothetical protein
MGLSVHTDEKQCQWSGNITAPHKKKFNCVGKALLAAFWDTQGILVLELVDNKATENADLCCMTMHHLKGTIQEK